MRELVRACIGTEKQRHRDYNKAKSRQIELQLQLESLLYKNTKLARNLPQISLVVLIGVLFLWFFFILGDDSHIREFLLEDVAQDAQRIIHRTQTWISFATIANSIRLQRFNRGQYAQSDWDRDAVAVLDSIRDFASLSEGEPADLLFGAVLAGSSDSKFVSAFNLRDLNQTAYAANEVGLAASDNSTGFCYTSMFLGNDSRRDPGRLVPDAFDSCCYEVTERPWWQTATHKDLVEGSSTVWTPSFVFFCFFFILVEKFINTQALRLVA
jgi:hypothetical protein